AAAVLALPVADKVDEPPVLEHVSLLERKSPHLQPTAAVSYIASGNCSHPRIEPLIRFAGRTLVVHDRRLDQAAGPAALKSMLAARGDQQKNGDDPPDQRL